MDGCWPALVSVGTARVWSVRCRHAVGTGMQSAAVGWGSAVGQTPRELTPQVSLAHLFGAELRRLRVRAGLSHQQLGARVSYSAALVGKVEKAERSASRQLAEACDRELNAGGALKELWAALAQSGARCRVEGTGPVFLTAPGGRPLGVAPVIRGRVAAAESAVGEDERDLLEALTRSNVSVGVLDALEAEALRVIGEYPRIPPARLRGWAQARLACVTALLGGVQLIEHRRRLCSAAALVAGIRSWLAFDLRDPSAAARFCRIAATAAREAQDTVLAAWVLGNRARILAYGPDPFLAERAAANALALADGHASPTLTAWLLAQAARARTATGHHAAGGRALAEAERQLDRVNDRVPELVYFDDCRLVSFIGHHHLLAGRPGPAAEHIQTSLVQLHPNQTRHRALTRLDLARAMLDQGEVEGACAQATVAVGLADEDLIEPVVRRAQALRRRLRTYARQMPAARELNDRIAAL